MNFSDSHMAIVFICIMMSLSGKKILIGITGSIAAYKTVLLVRTLTLAGAQVKVIMTKAATDFASPLVISTFLGEKVLSDLTEGDAWSNHVMLGRWADIMLIAPLSCNTLAKMASGCCDNLLLAVYFSATCPVVVAPAMDEDMWKHPATQRNINTLTGFGTEVLDVGDGLLASGLSGKGRMMEPADLFHYLEKRLTAKPSIFTGKKVLITAGPTYEPIDPVRYIGNHSTGKMGIELANSFIKQGAKVVLVLGPTQLNVPDGIELFSITTAIEMNDVVISQFEDSDFVICSAAVADYRPATIQTQKIKKQGLAAPPQIDLVENPDILRYCGHNRKPHQVVVGFALETENEKRNALEKMNRKQANIIVLNSLNDEGAGFRKNTNKVTLFTDKGAEIEFELADKSKIAGQIVSAIAEYATT